MNIYFAWLHMTTVLFCDTNGLECHSTMFSHTHTTRTPNSIHWHSSQSHRHTQTQIPRHSHLLRMGWLLQELHAHCARHTALISNAPNVC